MGFVQLGFLGALGALAVPIVVHLLFRRRARRVELGTIRFLDEILRRNARRKQVKRLFLLAFRMACVALIALLFARPYLMSIGSRPSRHFVAILIDRSASMQSSHEGERLIDTAVTKAREIIEEHGDQARVEAAFFDHAVHPIAASEDGTMSNVTLSDALVAPDESFTATNYGAALDWARDVCVQAGLAEKELHVFTDLQRSGLVWNELSPLSGDVRVHLHELGRRSSNNVAVTAADLNRSLIRPGEGAHLRVTVSNVGPFSMQDVPVRLNLRGGRRSFRKEQRIQLKAGQMESFDFEIEKLESGFWRGQVEVEVEDELSFDDRRFVGIMAAPAMSVLVVDGQPADSDVLSETYYLEAALRLATPEDSYADSPFAPTVVTHVDGETLPSVKGNDVVILANVGNLDAGEVKRLATFVREGGGLVVFTGENLTGTAPGVLESRELGVGKIVGQKRASDLPWRIVQWDEKHSVFEPFNDPEHGDLRRLAFAAYTQVEPFADVKVLASLRTGEPLLLERRCGKGSVLCLTSACDRQWSDWVRSRLYLPVVHQMLGHLTGLNEGGPVRYASIGSASVDDQANKPGIYERSRHWDVVNVNSRESEVDRCTASQFAGRFGVTLAGGTVQERTRVAAAIPSTIELRDDEIWHWLLLVLLVVLCAESVLANRTTA